MPALSPLFIDTAVGDVDLPVSARDLRAQADGRQPGVLGPTHLLAAAAGFALTVQPGVVYVPDGLAVPTLYRCEWSGAATSLALQAADSTNPRIDQLVARVYDKNIDGGTQRRWTLEVLPGTPAAGATLANRLGALALPARAVRLGDVLVAAGATSIDASAVRDRRPWARGAFAAWNGDPAAGDFVSSSDGSFTTIAASVRRLETSGGPIAIHVNGSIGTSAGGVLSTAALLIDGNEVCRQSTFQSAAGAAYPLAMHVPVVDLAPGTHTFAVAIARAAAQTAYTTTLYNNAAYGRPAMSITELVGARAANA